MREHIKANCSRIFRKPKPPTYNSVFTYHFYNARLPYAASFKVFDLFVFDLSVHLS